MNFYSIILYFHNSITQCWYEQHKFYGGGEGGCRVSIAESLVSCHMLYSSDTLDIGLEPPLMLVHVQVCGLKKWLSCHAGHQEYSRCRTRGESEESIAHRRQRVYKPSKRLPELRKVTSAKKKSAKFSINGHLFLSNLYALHLPVQIVTWRYYSTR